MQAAAAKEPARRTINGQRMVLLDEAEYLRLKQLAKESEPLLPEPNARGNHAAREHVLADSARDILHARRRLGWTQAELARRAGIRVETLNRLEKARRHPSVATLGKIERALREAEE